MPDCAYKNGIMPERPFEQLSEIEFPWARYKQKSIVVKEVKWDEKKQGWEGAIKKEEPVSF